MVTPHLQPITRRAWIIPTLLALMAFISLSTVADPTAQSVAHTEKVHDTPHFYQSDSRGHFAGGGQNYCFPTAVSDSFVYLAAHGFPKLLPPGIADPVQAQITLIKQLAAPDRMNTDPASGTGAAEACIGIQRQIEAAGYVCKSIEYRGWRLKSAASRPLPTLDWIKQAAADPHAAAWINIGWYVHGTTPQEWTRVSGHWVAVVGYGTDANGHDDPAILLVDNPAIPPKNTKQANQLPRLPDGTETPTHEEIAAEIMSTELASQGRLVGNFPGLPREAAGLYRVSGPGVSMSKKYDAAIIDGAVVLIISDHQP